VNATRVKSTIFGSGGRRYGSWAQTTTSENYIEKRKRKEKETRMSARDACVHEG
jgi:hypothetical protein